MSIVIIHNLTRKIGSSQHHTYEESKYMQTKQNNNSLFLTFFLQYDIYIPQETLGITWSELKSYESYC